MKLEAMAKLKRCNPMEGKDHIDWTHWNSVVEAKKNWGKKSLKPLYEVLDLWSGQECLDPRDKVYGVLGLASNADITVDYSKSVSNLYREVLESQREAIYKKGYMFADGFSLRLLANLRLKNNKEARNVRSKFLQAYTE